MRNIWLGPSLGILLSVAVPVRAADSVPDEEGKLLFTANKCQGCHSIKSKSIGVDESAAVADEGEEAAGDKDLKPPDLSAVGDKHDGKFLHDYLRKQATIQGRKHKRRFPGTKEERARLVDWLLSLKEPRK